MPIFEYKCNDCNKDFEKLIFGSSSEVKCPMCGSTRTNKKFSAFAMSGVEKSASSGCSSCSSSSCSTCH